jgi:hypothetical protein
VKGLEGVDQRLLDKLEGTGVQSISDLATSTASELLVYVSSRLRLFYGDLNLQKNLRG